MTAVRLTILLCCIVWLHGCATTPRITTLPSVCPKPREQPEKIMGPLPESLPALADYLPKNSGPVEAAAALQHVRRESGAAYEACILSRAGLIDWIRER